MSAPLLDVRLRRRSATFELDYELRADERCVGIFGPSGAGKTTLIECVAGWRRPTSGHVRVRGRTLFDADARVDLPLRQRGVGYVPQDILLFPHWNVRQNVVSGRPARPVRPAAHDLVERVLDFLELAPLADRAVDELSGGERHRVALARALCSEPDLLLLDEPLSSLDQGLKRRVLGDLLRVREQFDVPMLLISHDPVEVQVLCDRAQWIRSGRVVADGRPAEIVHRALAGGAPGEFENVLPGRVLEADGNLARVVVGETTELFASHRGLVAGERVVLGVKADDLLVARTRPRDLSARNVLPGRVSALQPGEEGVALHVTLADGTSLTAHLTQRSTAELGLAPGQDVHLVLKSRSIDVITRLPG